MDGLFLTILNMSMTGAFVVIAICLARLPLKKAPKIISYCLWAVAWFRLAVPFSIESIFSLMPFNTTAIPSNIAMQPVSQIDSGIPIINTFVSSSLPAATPMYSANPLQIWTSIGAYVWVSIAALMIAYGVISYFRMKSRLKSSVHIEDNIYENGFIKSPFVLGVLKPNIYLPFDLGGPEREYIIIHEETHIKRYDHIVKVVAYFILCLHWFNPLAWVAYLLMNADMEMSCDERVLKEIGPGVKKDYSLSLLSLSTSKRFFGGSPLAFSEGGLKTRIKNVLKFKDAPMILLIISVALTITLSVGLVLDRVDKDIDLSDDASIASDMHTIPPVTRETITYEEFQAIAAMYDVDRPDPQADPQAELNHDVAINRVQQLRELSQTPQVTVIPEEVDTIIITPVTSETYEEGRIVFSYAFPDNEIVYQLRPMHTRINYGSSGTSNSRASDKVLDPVAIMTRLP